MSINAPFVLVTQDVGHWAPVQLIETAKLDVFEVGFELGGKNFYIWAEI